MAAAAPYWQLGDRGARQQADGLGGVSAVGGEGVPSEDSPGASFPNRNADALEERPELIRGGTAGAQGSRAGCRLECAHGRGPPAARGFTHNGDEGEPLCHAVRGRVEVLTLGLFIGGASRAWFAGCSNSHVLALGAGDGKIKGQGECECASED